MKRLSYQRWSNIAFNVALAALVVVPVYAATTVGTNLNTGGTLTVTGASTLSSTLGVTGATTLSATSTHTYISNGLGVVGAPSYTFTGDLDNGIWSSGADTINFSTAGSERVRIDSSGRLGVGTSTPGTPLGVTGAAVITGRVTAQSFEATSTTATTSLSTGGLAVGTSQFIVQQSSGKVALGTTTPYANFSVQSGVGTANTDALVVATSSGAAVFGIDNDGHLFTSGPAPVLSSCGTSPAITGSDSGGTVTAGTGGPTACTLTFAKAFRYTPYCNVNSGATTASSTVTAISTTAVTFSIVPTVDSIKLYYSCAYHQ